MKENIIKSAGALGFPPDVDLGYVFSNMSRHHRYHEKINTRRVLTLGLDRTYTKTRETPNSPLILRDKSPNTFNTR